MKDETPLISQPFQRDRLTWLSYLLLGNCCFISAALGPLMPFMRAEMRLNYTVAALHLSAWALGVMVAGIAGARIMRTFGVPPTVLAAGIGITAGTGLLIGANIPSVTIGGALLGGMSSSIMGQTLYTIMAHRFAAERTVAIAEATIAGSIAAAMAPAAVSCCQRIGLGWRGALVFPLVAILPLIFSFRRGKAALPSLQGSTGRRRRLPLQYWVYWTVILLSVACEWSLIFWSADFLEHIAHLSKADAAAGVTAFLGAMLLGRIAGSRLARTFDISLLLPAASVLAIGGFLIFWLAQPAPLNLIGLFISGLGIANFYPLTLSAAIATAPEQASEATARVSAGTGAAILSTPLLLGLVADRTGIFLAYGIIAVLLCLSAGMVFLANWSARRRRPQAEPHPLAKV